MPSLRLSPLLVGLALSACTPEPEGRWTGGCEVDGGLRVVLEIDRFGDDRNLAALGTLHLADRPGEHVAMDCQRMGEQGATLSVGGCFGGWTGEADALFPFTAVAELERAEPSDRLAGTCELEGTSGALELWRTP